MDFGEPTVRIRRELFSSSEQQSNQLLFSLSSLLIMYLYILNKDSN